MRRHILIAGVACLLLSTVSAGCGANGGSGSKFEGIRWVLESYYSNGELKSAPQGSSVDALFERGKVSGNSGVNTYSGSYKASGSSLTVGRIATTLMAGPQELMELERAYVADLEKARSYTAGGETLTLFDNDGNELLAYSRGKAAPRSKERPGRLPATTTAGMLSPASSKGPP